MPRACACVAPALARSVDAVGRSRVAQFAAAIRRCLCMREGVALPAPAAVDRDRRATGIVVRAASLADSRSRCRSCRAASMKRMRAAVDPQSRNVQRLAAVFAEHSSCRPPAGRSPAAARGCRQTAVRECAPGARTAIASARPAFDAIGCGHRSAPFDHAALPKRTRVGADRGMQPRSTSRSPPMSNCARSAPPPGVRSGP